MNQLIRVLVLASIASTNLLWSGPIVTVYSSGFVLPESISLAPASFGLPAGTLVVADADNGAILGATFVGPRAGDLIGQTTLAIEMGATLTDLSEILYAHPGLSETLQESSENALGKAVHILGKA